MASHRSLGRPGAPGGEGDERRRIAVHRFGLARRARLGDPGQRPRAAHHDRARDRPQGRAGDAEQVGARRADERARPCGADRLVQARAPGPGIHEHGAGTEVVDGEQHDVEFDRHRNEQQHGIPRRDPACAEPGGYRGHITCQRIERQAPPPPRPPGDDRVAGGVPPGDRDHARGKVGVGHPGVRGRARMFRHGVHSQSA